MTTSRTIPESELPWKTRKRGEGGTAPHLVIIWSLEEPDRIGEAIAVERTLVIGRGAGRPDDPAPRAQLIRQRPAGAVPMHPIESSRISRVQLKVEPRADGKLEITNLGQAQLAADGQKVDSCVVGPGSTISLKNALSFVVVQRPTQLPELRRAASLERFDFGKVDKHGIVGESAAAWALRDELAFVAAAPGHVLVRGPSGVGKELASAALHALSPRAGKPLIARNAATFPEGLVDAELFGNVRGYPNPGMAERTGLIGEADGTTLFLDEIGELPAHLQAHLLRVLDANGEYQRLGDATVRRSDLRFVAATNRNTDELKHDFVARLIHRVEIPGLDERREDIPLIVRHMIANAFAADASLAAKFSDNGIARIDPDLIDALVRHQYTHHMRELHRLVWLALSSSREEFVSLTADVEEQLDLPSTVLADPPSEPLDRAALVAALEANAGNVMKTTRALGLKNRYALYRHLKAHNIPLPKRDDDKDAKDE